MNSIKNVPARVLNRRPGHSLEAEREQFDKTQASGGAAGGRAGGRRPLLFPSHTSLEPGLRPSPWRPRPLAPGRLGFLGCISVTATPAPRPPPARAQVNRKRAPAPGPEAAWGAGVAGTEMPPGTEMQLRGPGGPGTGQVFRD